MAINKNQKQISKKGNKFNNKGKFVQKPAATKPLSKNNKLVTKQAVVKHIKQDVIESDDEELAEDELKKMLGTSDNSDIDSDEFSDEVEIESKESKVNKKRKLSLSDDEEDEEDDEDDDSFIDDGETEDEKPLTKQTVVQIKKEKIHVKNETKEEEKVPTEKENKSSKMQKKKERKEKNKQNMLAAKEIFEDTDVLEDASLKKEVKERLVDRMRKTVVLTGIPSNFQMRNVKNIVPDLVSFLMPYNQKFHKHVNTIYVDVDSPQRAVEVAAKLNKSVVGAKKIRACVQNRVNDDVDQYNCTRLVVSNLTPNTTTEEIKRVLPKAVRIEMLPVKTNKKVPQTAFAQYGSVKDAITDYDTKHGIEIHQSPINLKFQVRHNANVKSVEHYLDRKCLIVYNLDNTVQLNDLKKLFPQSSNVKIEEGRGRAFVHYENEEQCLVDKNSAQVSKPIKKWGINFARTKAFIDSKLAKQPKKEKRSKENKQVHAEEMNIEESVTKEVEGEVKTEKENESEEKQEKNKEPRKKRSKERKKLRQHKPSTEHKENSKPNHNEVIKSKGERSNNSTGPVTVLSREEIKEQRKKRKLMKRLQKKQEAKNKKLEEIKLKSMNKNTK